MSRSMGAAKSGLRWMNMDKTTTARLRVSSSYSSSTAAQSLHLVYHIRWRQLNSAYCRPDLTVDWFIHLSDMVVGCSSMNSSGAGTNMLTVLGADNRLVFVGPAEEQLESSFLSLHLYREYFIDWPVSQVLMLWGALDWCSSCLFISWLMVRAPREPRFTWRYWAGDQTKRTMAGLMNSSAGLTRMYGYMKIETQTRKRWTLWFCFIIRIKVRIFFFIIFWRGDKYWNC